jgi:hypothetical protein
MSTYQLTSKQLLNNYAVVQTLEPTEIAVGESVIIDGLGEPFDGTFTVWQLPQYLLVGTDQQGFLQFDYNVPLANQVLYIAEGTNVQRVAVTTGTIDYTQTVTWINDTDVANYIGILVATTEDATFLVNCAAAANEFCYRRRQEAGYKDSLATAPSADVALGTIAYGSFLYRQRGSVSDFASFDGMVSGGSNGLSPMIKQLLGVNRAQVA